MNTDITIEECNTIIESRIQRLNNLLQKKLITIEDYRHTHSRIRKLLFNN